MLKVTFKNKKGAAVRCVIYNNVNDLFRIYDRHTLGISRGVIVRDNFKKLFETRDVKIEKIDTYDLPV